MNNDEEIKNKFGLKTYEFYLELREKNKMKSLSDKEYSKAKEIIYNFISEYEFLINGKCQKEFNDYYNNYQSYENSTDKINLNNDEPNSKNEQFKLLNICTQDKARIAMDLQESSTILSTFNKNLNFFCFEDCQKHLLKEQYIHENCLRSCMKLNYYSEKAAKEVLKGMILSNQLKEGYKI